MPASRTSDDESPPAVYEACGIPLRRSQRPAWSCTECTRRKIKCSKQVPCTACERKKRGHLCRIEPHGPATSLRNAARLISECNPDLRLASGAELDHLRVSVAELQARVRHLEGFVERILPYVPESVRLEFDPIHLGLHSHLHAHPHPTDPHHPLVSFPHPSAAGPPPPGESYAFPRSLPPPPGHAGQASSSRAGSRMSTGTGQHTPVTDSGLTGSPHSPSHSGSGSHSGPGSHHSHDSDSESIGHHHQPLSPAPSPPGEDVKPLWGPGGELGPVPHHHRRAGPGGDEGSSVDGQSAPVSGWATPAGMLSMEELSGQGLLPQAGVPMYGFQETLGMYAAQQYGMAAAAAAARAGAF